MENKSVEVNYEKSLPVLKVLLKNSILIVLITVLCALCGLGYGIMKTKPSYTASRSVIFRTEMNDGGSNSNVQTNQASLAKLYLPSVSSIVRSAAIITLSNDNMVATINEIVEVTDDLTVEFERTPTAKEIAEEISERRTLAEKKEVNFPVWRVEEMQRIITGEQSSTITSGAVGMSYKSTSLIFTLTYTDKNEELASEKLETVVETVAKHLCNYIQAGNVTLINTQYENDISISYNYAKFVGVAGAIGFAGTVAVILLIYVLDNTLKSKKELEELTGADVLSMIEKND